MEEVTFTMESLRQHENMGRVGCCVVFFHQEKVFFFHVFFFKGGFKETEFFFSRDVVMIYIDSR